MRRKLWIQRLACSLCGALLGPLFLSCSPEHGGASGSQRPIEARLVSWKEYAPFGKLRDEDKVRFRSVLRESSERARKGAPDDIRSLASLELLAGRTESALRRYEELARQSPQDAGVLSELAAAYLTLADGEAPPEPVFRVHALATADRAVAVDPKLPAALFNRALALEELYLWPEALKAWQTYRDLDSSSGWSQEAQKRIEALETKLQPRPWGQDRKRLDRAAVGGDAATVRKIVAQYPQESRTYAEETVLASWAKAEAEHRQDEAGRQLTIARSLGIALEALHDDRMVRDAVAAIDRADPGRRADLVQGHLTYRKGLDEYEPLHLTQAKPLLRSARDLLQRGGSPFAAWATFHLAICDWYGAQYDRSLAVLAGLGQEAERRGYLALLGRVYWMEGISYLQKSQPTNDLMALQKSLSIFDRLGEMENVASLEERVAYCLSYLGETDESWRHLDRALSLRREISTPRRFYSLFYATHELCLRLQQTSVAAYFLTEVVEAARQWGSAPGLAEALWSRSKAHHLLGQSDQALSDLHEAERYLPSIQASSLQRRIQGDVSWVTAEARLGSDVPGAINDYTRALELYQKENYPDNLIAIYLERGRAFLKTGDDEPAEADFAKALSLYETWRQQVDEPDSRVSFFDQAEAAFNQMILFQVTRKGHPLKALDYVERARARVLFETVLGARKPEPGSFPKPLQAESILQRLPKGVALVEYAVLPDRLLIWILQRDGIEIVSQKVGAASLTERIEEFREEVVKRKTRGKQTDKELFRLLVQPALERAPDAGQLVFIPDKPIHALPFAALRNPESGHYLIEERAVAVAPSATIYLLAQEHDRQRIGSEDKALVVGNPALGPEDPLDLPAAADEARAVARLYPGAHLLLGPQATKRAVLALAPQSTMLHFAVHAVENRDAPSRSRMVLAPEDGDVDKGSLFVSDLASLRLSRTRLVVLSACQTAGGRISKTEGADSLARAFLAAGVPAVVASLWPVEDEATSALLAGFHRRVRQGIDPVHALQETQRELIDSYEKDLQDPVAWAGFEVVGGTSSGGQRVSQ